MSVYVFSGRFQPLHKGHISFLEYVKKRHPGNLLIICIIRNSMNNNPETNLRFSVESRKKHNPFNNPLPNWNRYMLLSLAVKSNPLLRDNTEILFRNRSDTNWQESIMDLPEDRIWILPNYSKEPFDEEKKRHYLLKNERVELVDFYDKNNQYSGDEIRRYLRDKKDSINYSFLPEACKDYFQVECLKYFL